MNVAHLSLLPSQVTLGPLIGPETEASRKHCNPYISLLRHKAGWRQADGGSSGANSLSQVPLQIFLGPGQRERLDTHISQLLSPFSFPSSHCLPGIEQEAHPFSVSPGTLCTKAGLLDWMSCVGF